MADFSEIKTEIRTNIKTNGNQEITGAVLQNTLIGMVDATQQKIIEKELKIFDSTPQSQSVVQDGAKLIFNSFNNLVNSTYSSILLYKPNTNLFANIRMSNIILSHGEVLVLSKKVDSLDRYASIEDIPFGTMESVYLVKTDIITANNNWDMVVGNYMGQLNSYMNNNFSVVYNSIPQEDLNRGLFIKYSAFPNKGYINNSGVFISTPTVEWYSSEYISVIEGMVVQGRACGQSGNAPILTMYDSYKNCITIHNIESTLSASGPEYFRTIIPQGISYIRIAKFMNNDSYVIMSSVALAAEYISTNTPKLYSHSLQKPYDFYGKNALFFGDSVTYGVSSNPFTSPLENCWRNLFCEKAGLQGVNYAVSGSFIYDNNYNGEEHRISSILSQVKEYITDDSYDFIFIAGGINDFWSGKLLGKESDEGNISFYGALKAICTHIKSNAPSAIVIFLTPLNYSRAGGYTPVIDLNAYRNAISEVAVMNGFSVVDQSVFNFPPLVTDSEYKNAIMGDGIHPTALGHKMMADNLYSILGV